MLELCVDLGDFLFEATVGGGVGGQQVFVGGSFGLEALVCSLQVLDFHDEFVPLRSHSAVGVLGILQLTDHIGEQLSGLGEGVGGGWGGLDRLLVLVAVLLEGGLLLGESRCVFGIGTVGDGESVRLLVDLAPAVVEVVLELLHALLLFQRSGLSPGLSRCGVMLQGSKLLPVLLLQCNDARIVPKGVRRLLKALAGLNIVGSHDRARKTLVVGVGVCCRLGCTAALAGSGLTLPWRSHLTRRSGALVSSVSNTALSAQHLSVRLHQYRPGRLRIPCVLHTLHLSCCGVGGFGGGSSLVALMIVCHVCSLVSVDVVVVVQKGMFAKKCVVREGASEDRVCC